MRELGENMKRLSKFAFVTGAMSFAAIGALAQTAPAPPKLANSAAAAALFKDVKTAGDPRPIPTAPPAATPTPRMPSTNFVPVTDAMLRNPDPNDWIMMRGNYQGWGYSSLDQINKGNVKGLQLVWARLMEPGINEATPHRLQRRDVSWPIPMT